MHRVLSMTFAQRGAVVVGVAIVVGIRGESKDGGPDRAKLP